MRTLVSLLALLAALVVSSDVAADVNTLTIELYDPFDNTVLYPDGTSTITAWLESAGRQTQCSHVVGVGGGGNPIPYYCSVSGASSVFLVASLHLTDYAGDFIANMQCSAGGAGSPANGHTYEVEVTYGTHGYGCVAWQVN